MKTPAKSPCCCCASASSGPEPRRGFLAKTLAVVLGGLALAVPAAASVVSFLNPLRQKGQAGKFLRLTLLETLPEDGTPRKFPIVMDRSDAWSQFPSEPVGAVFLRRTPEGVQALHVVCPHAGCFVEYHEAQKQFFCPCHIAHFALDGARQDATSPSPRDLDTLEVELRNSNEVWVNYQTFRTGIPQKVAEA